MSRLTDSTATHVNYFVLCLEILLFISPFVSFPESDNARTVKVCNVKRVVPKEKKSILSENLKKLKKKKNSDENKAVVFFLLFQHCTAKHILYLCVIFRNIDLSGMIMTNHD